MEMLRAMGGIRRNVIGYCCGWSSLVLIMFFFSSMVAHLILMIQYPQKHYDHKMQSGFQESLHEIKNRFENNSVKCKSQSTMNDNCDECRNELDLLNQTLYADTYNSFTRVNTTDKYCYAFFIDSLRVEFHYKIPAQYMRFFNGEPEEDMDYVCRNQCNIVDFQNIKGT